MIADPHAQNHENIDVGQACGLREQSLINRSNRGSACLVHAHARRGELPGKTSHRILKAGIIYSVNSTRRFWCSCDLRASNVVTIEVPTLLPILRMKLMIPATELFFSGAIPI